ncbi:hypothetical protein HPB51_012018 [Rhipicephalus microplus]|uniref:Uncharacterized protein n=1 Tax=Rhipicephalus microplus TaxID=6941 RepID=A0A9J6F2F1_RHIMP|nr:hypothetical protein HPB51_012018 [Rhipicephalus microplus]
MWKERMEKKGSLGIYKASKQEIRKENLYDNNKENFLVLRTSVPFANMSLVAEVLQPKESFEKGNLNAAVSRLSRKIEDLKTDMERKLVSKYDMFSPYDRDAEQLVWSLKTALEDVEEVFQNIEIT